MSYKYNIKERMDKLPHLDFKRLRKEIPKALGKTCRTFDRYCTLTADEYGDVPAQDLAIIASYLGCKSDDLKNYTVRNKQIQQKMERNRKIA